MILARCIGVVGLLSIMIFASFAVADGASNQAASSSAPVAAKRKPQIGIASFYHATLRGMRTSNGERYDPKKMTAAHRRLPLGTWVQVTRLRGGHSVVVKINDRLPPRSRAIIDLSTAAARKLAMIKMGVARVRLEVVDKPSDAVN